jgi:hypothetical protein
MTEAEALAYLTLHSDPVTEPTLSAGDLSLIIMLSKRVDRFGLYPADNDWEETYDVQYAVSQAWLIKAGRIANRYMFMSGGKMFSRQQYFDHCMKMYYRFAMKSPLKAFSLAPRNTWLGWTPNNANV